MRVFREQLLSASLSAENFRVKRQFWSMFLGKNCCKNTKKYKAVTWKKKVFKNTKKYKAVTWKKKVFANTPAK